MTEGRERIAEAPAPVTRTAAPAGAAPPALASGAFGVGPRPIDALTPAHVIALQRTAGNAVVNGWLQTLPRPLSATIARQEEHGAPGGGQMVVASSDPQLNGRPVEEVADDLTARLGRHWESIPVFRRGAEASRNLERRSAEEYDAISWAIDLFNDEELPDPARWDPVIALWDDVEAGLDHALAIDVTPDNLNEYGQAAAVALQRFDEAFRVMQRTREEFSRYLGGFTGSAETVLTVSTVVRDVSFAVAVGLAVVVAAPVVYGAAATFGSGTLGLGATGTAVFATGTTAVAMGGLGAAIEGGGQAIAATVVEGAGVLDDLIREGRSLDEAIAAFDWSTIEGQGWEGMQRGFVDGILAYAGLRFERALAAPAAAGVTRLLGRTGRILLARALRLAMTRAVVGGSSGAVIGALDAGIKAAMAGKSPAEIRQAMHDGFMLGAALGTVLGGAGGALEARATERLRRAMAELPELLVRDPEEFARRYRELVDSLTPEQRAAWDTEMQGRRFVDAEHYGPAAAEHAAGRTARPPAHRYGRQAFEDWSQAAQMLDEHARTGQPLTQQELEAAHAAALQHMTSRGPGHVRGPDVDVVAGGGLGVEGLWSALSPEEIAVLQSNPHLRLEARGMVDAALTPEQVAAHFETAIIRYPPGNVVQAQLDEFFRWFAATRGTMDPTAFAAAAQRRLVSIHPFIDGNGRVSRLVMDHALQTRGLPPALLERPNLDYLISEAAWTQEVRRGVVEAYETVARHADLFNVAAAQFDARRVATTWGLLLGLVPERDAFVRWLYPDAGDTSPRESAQPAVATP